MPQTTQTSSEMQHSAGGERERDSERSRRESSSTDTVYEIASLSHEGLGVARQADGKVIFIDGALPFERVHATVARRRKKMDRAEVRTILHASSQRVAPACAYFGLHRGACGGCRMQHLHPSAQVAIKQRALEDQLWHLARVRPQRILPALHGPYWGYRHRARMSVRYVHKKEDVLIGFHERAGRYLTDMESCAVLPPQVSRLLLPLRALIKSMDARQTVPQIEVACGEDTLALVLRHMEPLSEGDKDKLRDFALAHADIGLEWWLQPKGPATVHLLDDSKPSNLHYSLPEFALHMPFKPTDFTQVNPYINQAMVSRALRLLDAQTGERIIDWFCGLGNFTLPLATCVSRKTGESGSVLGIEGSATLVARAESNAQTALASHPSGASAEHVQFAERNLFEMTPEILVADGCADRWLIDPPRDGAFELVKCLAALRNDTDAQALAAKTGWQPPRRIVYVSCNPATLARDAEVLVQQAGYQCSAAGVINMFPHTAHTESMAVFDWNAPGSAVCCP